MNQDTIALLVMGGALVIALAVRKIALVLVRRRFNAQHATHIDELAYRDRAWMLNAGIVANLIWGSATLGASQALAGQWPTAIVLCSLAAACWIGRRIVAAYVLPALAIPCVILLGWDIQHSLATGTNPTPNPIGKILDVGASDTLAVIAFAGIASLIIAIPLTMPMRGTDNGNVLHPVLTSRLGSKAAKRVQLASLMVLLGDLLVNVGWALSPWGTS